MGVAVAQLPLFGLVVIGLRQGQYLVFFPCLLVWAMLTCSRLPMMRSALWAGLVFALGGVAGSIFSDLTLSVRSAYHLALSAASLMFLSAPIRIRCTTSASLASYGVVVLGLLELFYFAKSGWGSDGVDLLNGNSNSYESLLGFLGAAVLFPAMARRDGLAAVGALLLIAICGKRIVVAAVLAGLVVYLLRGVPLPRMLRAWLGRWRAGLGVGLAVVLSIPHLWYPWLLECLSEAGVDGFGRFGIWGHLSLSTGMGLGASSWLTQQATFGALELPLSEYFRLAIDYTPIGAFAFWLLLMRALCRVDAGLALGAVLGVLALTDNIFVYATFFALPLGLYLGQERRPLPAPESAPSVIEGAPEVSLGQGG